ncbi:Phospholipase A2, major isoenzyme [Desmophyllum pertusum]|uniref:Phospholipase A2 n=1 Tax=Desmophyllum pertusum TaxID=174260 RepID=A0A9X0CFP4_9CNID|nr:Phospholipase A2, major isoenzyme [Desmophyllum pertusum]
MKGIFLVSLTILATALSFPSRKNQEKDALLEDVGQLMDKPHKFIRTERNLIQFHSMITCTTSLSSSYYIDYGCYCGYGGKGTPVDDTDRCCKVHDECYESIQNSDLCSFSSAVYWKKYKRLDDTCTGCADADGTCKRAICECDGAAARCFAETEHTYNEKYYNWQASC